MAMAWALAIAGLAMGGCSPSSNILEPKRIDYKSAQQVPTLEIPPDLTAPSGDDRYAVPESKQGPTTFSKYSKDRAATAKTPVASTGLLPGTDRVRIERAGTQRWLVVKARPEDLWPELKQFWLETGFVIKSENLESGVMETDWAENRAKLPQDFIRNAVGKVFDDIYSTAERDKFRTRLERGTEPGTTEVYISHRGMIEVVVAEGRSQSTRWQPRPADPELEAEMLRRVMARIGVDDAKAATQLAEKGPENAHLRNAPNGIRMLSVDEEFDRAWRRVGLALDRVGFTVEDRDRSKGLYFVRVAESSPATAKSSGGFWSKLAFWRGDDKAHSAEQYQIALSEAGKATDIEVRDKAGGKATTQVAGRILDLLYEQLK